MFVTRRVTAEIFSTIDKAYEKARHGFRNGPTDFLERKLFRT